MVAGESVLFTRQTVPIFFLFRAMVRLGIETVETAFYSKFHTKYSLSRGERRMLFEISYKILSQPRGPAHSIRNFIQITRADRGNDAFYSKFHTKYSLSRGDRLILFEISYKILAQPRGQAHSIRNFIQNTRADRGNDAFYSKFHIDCSLRRLLHIDIRQKQ
jgi:hypothetical protein